MPELFIVDLNNVRKYNLLRGGLSTDREKMSEELTADEYLESLSGVISRKMVHLNQDPSPTEERLQHKEQ